MDMKFNVEVIKSKKRKKTLCMAIVNRTVVVRAPLKTTNYDIKSFINQNTIWIKEHLKLIPNSKKYVDGEEFLLFGKKYKLKVIYANVRTIKIYTDGKYLVLVRKQNEKVVNIKKAFETFYKTNAKEYIIPIAHKLSEKLNKKINRIFVKRVNSIWGSCSNSQNLNFNYKLALAPKKVVDYIITHEVCHLKHHNHKKEFWNLVSNFIPNYKQHENWLKINGNKLHI